MKVVCKNNDKHIYYDEDEYELQIHLNILSTDKWGKKGDNHLIIGKAYEVVTSDIDVKSGIEYYYSSTRFMTLDEYRESKLNDIGI